MKKWHKDCITAIHFPYIYIFWRQFPKYGGKLSIKCYTVVALTDISRVEIPIHLISPAISVKLEGPMENLEILEACKSLSNCRWFHWIKRYRIKQLSERWQKVVSDLLSVRALLSLSLKVTWPKIRRAFESLWYNALQTIDIPCCCAAVYCRFLHVEEAQRITRSTII